MMRDMRIGLATAALPLLLTVALPFSLSSTAQPLEVPLAVQRVVEKLQAQFPKVEGEVLEVTGDGLTLDLGAKDTLQPGMELIVFREGRELRHPKTGAVLGRMEEELGRISIREVQEKFSVGVLMSAKPGAQVGAGDRVRITAGKIRLGLSPLVNQTGGKDPADTITDALTGALERTNRFQVLVSPGIGTKELRPEALLKDPVVVQFVSDTRVDYLLIPVLRRVPNQRRPYLDVQLLSLGQGRSVLSVALPYEPPPPRPMVAGSQGVAQPPVAQPKESIWSTLLGMRRGPAEPGFSQAASGAPVPRTIGQLDKLIHFFDMADVGGVPHAVMSDGQTIFFQRLEEQGLRPQAEYQPSRLGQILGVQFAHLGGGPNVEVIVNRYIPDFGASAILLTYDGSRVQILQENIPYFLLALDERGSGRRESLWGQGYEQAQFFGARQVYRLTFASGRISRGDAVPVPRSFRATGATVANFDRTGKTSLVFVDQEGYLQISKGTETVWSSRDRVGGSYASAVVTRLIGTAPQQEFFYMEPFPVAIDLDGDGIDEVLLPRNAYSTVLANPRLISWGEVIVLVREPTGFSLRALTPQLDGAVAGLGVIGKESPSIAYVLTKRKNFPSTGGETRIYLSQGS